MVSSQKLVQGASALLAVANKAYKSVQDVVPALPTAYVPENLPRWQLAEYLKRSSDKGRSLKGSPVDAVEYFEARTEKKCDYPLEVVILQDSAPSFEDDFPTMVNSEIPEMVKGIEALHPKSTFGVVSYTDKPIWPFGLPDLNWCWKIEQKLSASPQDLINIYNKMRGSGGGDAPQNSLGALFNTLYSKNIGWNSTKNARRLIVISTDALSHYDGDGSSRQDMTPFSGKFDEKNAETQCVTEFYPSLPQVVRAVLDVSNGQVPPYVAALINDFSPKKKVVGAWKSFAAAIGESPLFVRDRSLDSSNFWEMLSEIIYAMDVIECDLPTTTSTTTKSTGTTTTFDLSSSIAASSTTTFDLSSSTSATTTSPISSTTTSTLSSSTPSTTAHMRRTTIATTARQTTKATTTTTTTTMTTTTPTTSATSTTATKTPCHCQDENHDCSMQDDY